MQVSDEVAQVVKESEGQNKASVITLIASVEKHVFWYERDSVLQLLIEIAGVSGLGHIENYPAAQVSCLGVSCLQAACSWQMFFAACI